jgi:hypothetical protein
LRTFKGLVKQVRIDENETLIGHVLDLAFPLFRGTKTLSEQQQRVRANFYQGRGRQLRGGEPRRRYSGGSLGEALPRNRYYTVCPPMPSGGRSAHRRRKRSADWGLLAAELDAYADWSVSGLVMVFDWSDREVLPGFCATYRIRRYRILFVSSSSGLLAPAACQMFSSRRKRAILISASTIGVAAICS